MLLVPRAGTAGPQGSRVSGDGEGLSYGPLDPYEGALGSAGAGKPSRVGPGFLEEIPSLRVGSSRLDCADQDPWSFYYGGESRLALLHSPRGPYSLQNGSSVRTWHTGYAGSYRFNATGWRPQYNQFDPTVKMSAGVPRTRRKTYGTSSGTGSQDKALHRRLLPVLSEGKKGARQVEPPLRGGLR